MHTPHKPSLHAYLPLAAVVLVVGALAAASVWYWDLVPMFAFMGWFFLVFGGLKLIKLRSFVSAYRSYDVVASRSRIYGYVYPFLELAFGLAYLFVWQIERVSVVVIIVMLVSAYGVHQKLQGDEEVVCACLGTVFKVPMTWVTLVENILMAVMAFIVIM